MKRTKDDIEEKEKGGTGLSRRGFAGALLAGLGLMASGIGRRIKTATVSMKEASHYISLDKGKPDKP